VDELGVVLQDAGGVGAAPELRARLHALLAAELDRGAAELARPRSGYAAPVTVALAPDAGGTRAALPLDRDLRADPQAAGERGWLLCAALVGALAEAGAAADRLTAGAWSGHLALRAPGGDAELAALSFEDQVSGVDRLRARALAVPAAVLDDVADLRAPIGSAHPLRIAAQIAALGGRPADPASVAALEDVVLAALEGPGGGAARPHDDPDPSLRIARRILQRLDGMGKWGGYHTEFTHLARGFAPSDRARAVVVGEALLAAGLLREKPSVGQRHVFLDPRRAGDIRALIDEGRIPPDLDLP
jgi:hypothetical protein